MKSNLSLSLPRRHEIAYTNPSEPLSSSLAFPTMAPQQIIIDTDPGVDDVPAILMALASSEIDVALISIVFGNTHAPVAHSNLLKVYHALAKEIDAHPAAAERYARLRGASKTVLALGEDGPIGGDKALAAYFVSALSGDELMCSTEGMG